MIVNRIDTMAIHETGQEGNRGFPFSNESEMDRNEA